MDKPRIYQEFCVEFRGIGETGDWYLEQVSATLGLARAVLQRMQHSAKAEHEHTDWRIRRCITLTEVVGVAQYRKEDHPNHEQP